MAVSTTMHQQTSARPNHAVSESAVEFIPNEAFDSLGEDELLRMPAGTTLYADRDDEQPTDLTAAGSFDSLHSLPLLSAEGEAFLFRKMNYLKFRAASLRSGSVPEPAAESHESQNLLADAEGVRNHIAECNLRLVISIARKFATHQTDFDDLVIEGNMILLKAIDKFDVARGFRFSTYATHSVQRHFYRWSKQKLRRWNKEMAAAPELINDLAATEVENADVDGFAIEEQRLQELIARMDECLDEREHFVVRERFGIGDSGVVRTLRDIAGEIGLSKERVRQIELKALTKLRAFFGELQPDLLAAS